MRRTKALAAAASLCLVLGAAGCGGKKDESKEELVDDLSAELQDGGQGYDEEVADCFAEIVVDEVGVEAMRDVDIKADDPPEEIKGAIAAANVRAADECDLGGNG